MIINESFVKALFVEEKNLQEKLEHVRGMIRLYGKDPGAVDKPQTGAQPRAPGGLRDMLRTLLTEKAEGLKPTEAALALEKNGFKYAATTPLKVAVGTELYRMAKKGQIAKRDGRYFSH